MKIAVTGSKGFVGRNLIWNLHEIQEGKNRTRPNLRILEVVGIDIDSTDDDLKKACSECDFVFNLAGVNRPENEAEFTMGNVDFAKRLLEMLKVCENKCPVMLSSSIQASLKGRFEGSSYGRSKLGGEELFFEYGRETGAKVLVYRFPNIFGKWCRPNYNSVVATFCNAVANDLDYSVDDPKTELELVYIDDVVSELLDALEENEHRIGDFCKVPVTYNVTLGRIVELLKLFREISNTKIIPDIPSGSFEKKLLSTYLSYLPEQRLSYPLDMNVDDRGIFTELIKTVSAGQISINIARPGITRGEHWHNSKWEIFIVVAGHGLIQERKIGINPETGEEYPVIEFEVSGEKMQAVQMIPGYAHNIVNLSKTENLVTVMWANEIFDEGHPDTFYEKVSRKVIK